MKMVLLPKMMLMLVKYDEAVNPWWRLCPGHVVLAGGTRKISKEPHHRSMMSRRTVRIMVSRRRSQPQFSNETLQRSRQISSPPQLPRKEKLQMI